LQVYWKYAKIWCNLNSKNIILHFDCFRVTNTKFSHSVFPYTSYKLYRKILRHIVLQRYIVYGPKQYFINVITFVGAFYMINFHVIYKHTTAFCSNVFSINLNYVEVVHWTYSLDNRRILLLLRALCILKHHSKNRIVDSYKTRICIQYNIKYAFSGFLQVYQNIQLKMQKTI